MERGGSVREEVSAESLEEFKLPRFLTGVKEQLRHVSYPLALSCSTTIITFALGVCALLVFQKTIPDESWLGIWKRWDALHFLDLAQNGYPHQSDGRERAIAFLPVYPLGIRVAHLFIPEWHTVAVVLSNCCGAAALIYLFLLVQMEYDGAVARRAVLFCAVFPTAYFLHVAYSESIF